MARTAKLDQRALAFETIAIKILGLAAGDHCVPGALENQRADLMGMILRRPRADLFRWKNSEFPGFAA